MEQKNLGLKNDLDFIMQQIDQLQQSSDNIMQESEIKIIMKKVNEEFVNVIEKVKENKTINNRDLYNIDLIKKMILIIQTLIPLSNQKITEFDSFKEAELSKQFEAAIDLITDKKVRKLPKNERIKYLYEEVEKLLKEIANSPNERINLLILRYKISKSEVKRTEIKNLLKRKINITNPLKLSAIMADGLALKKYAEKQLEKKTIEEWSNDMSLILEYSTEAAKVKKKHI